MYIKVNLRSSQIHIDSERLPISVFCRLKYLSRHNFPFSDVLKRLFSVIFPRKFFAWVSICISHYFAVVDELLQSSFRQISCIVKIIGLQHTAVGFV